MTITVSGKTIEEAIAKAVSELQTTREQLSYQVIEEPQKGFLGIIGVKPAKIEAHVIPDSVEIAQSFLQTTVSLMGQEPTITKTESNDKILFHLTATEDTGRLIGKRGQTLESLEYLTNLVCNRGEQKYRRIELDIGDYRERRKQALEQLALRVADKVKTIKQPSALEPMNALERKIIHEKLKRVKGVETRSEGSGLGRHIVILPRH
ncbi:RNA-binding cell elongation regulator Jag/EloR [Halalkalibacter akibai]|uniref:RNA-binding protein KhpB n=1 Tax=Halalkalibacter akibai (strain ATCC 43226 / DSM 21942 / CIP 109018 / JCM 9157 / 1139) TaxID=1236973 RepID=W4QR79_HALA3|nr:RNA-binding cell elongation regulator Jag/EloR [Halalkalibacter akibai]GAE34412.1 RNA-binding protein Jag [Halalkalibacter akibai JCM 9157]